MAIPDRNSVAFGTNSKPSEPRACRGSVNNLRLLIFCDTSVTRDGRTSGRGADERRRRAGSEDPARLRVPLRAPCGVVVRTAPRWDVSRRRPDGPRPPGGGPFGVRRAAAAGRGDRGPLGADHVRPAGRVHGGPGGGGVHGDGGCAARGRRGGHGGRDGLRDLPLGGAGAGGGVGGGAQLPLAAGREQRGERGDDRRGHPSGLGATAQPLAHVEDVGLGPGDQRLEPGRASRISRPADQPSRTSLTQWVPRYTVVAPTLRETTADTTDSTRRVTTVEAR